MSGLYASAALLLVVAGAAKLSRPGGDSAGLLGFRARSGLVRLVGAGEVAVGAAGLMLAGPVAVSAVGLAYTAFAVAVFRAWRAGSKSCGCFGALDAPPSRIHVVVNLVLAAASFSAVGFGGAGEAPLTAVAAAFAEQRSVGAALVVEIAVLAGLLLVSLTALPEALDARKAQPGGSTLFRAVAAPGASRGPEAPGGSTLFGSLAPGAGRGPGARP